MKRTHTKLMLPSSFLPRRCASTSSPTTRRFSRSLVYNLGSASTVTDADVEGAVSVAGTAATSAATASTVNASAGKLTTAAYGGGGTGYIGFLAKRGSDMAVA